MVESRGVGVYSITNTNNGKQYIGSSANIRKRWYEHIRTLRNGEHHSAYLQRSWNKYGEECFSFTLVEECDKSCLLEREQWWMDNTLPAYNMNPVAGSVQGRKAGKEERAAMSERASLQWKNPDFRLKFSASCTAANLRADVRERRSNAALIRYSSDPSQALNHSKKMKENWGSEEYREKMKATRSFMQQPDFKLLMSEVKTKQCMKPEARQKMNSLGDQEAINVLLLRQQGLTLKYISDLLEIPKHVVSDLCRGRTYTHINRETLEVDWSLLTPRRR